MSYQLVHATDDEKEAGGILAMLKDHQLAVEPRVNTGLAIFGVSAAANVGAGMAGQFELHVPDDQLETAQELVEEYLGGHLEGMSAEDEPPPAGQRAQQPVAEQTFPVDRDQPAEPNDDQEHFARAMLFGLTHMLGFGTIAALESASKISAHSVRRTIAFVVPIVWYLLLLSTLAFIGSTFNAFSLARGFGYAGALIAVNCLALIVYRRVSGPEDAGNGIRVAVFWYAGLAGLLYFLTVMVLAL